MPEPEPVVVRTATEYAEALGPHEGHDTYRADLPSQRQMGKGCRTDGAVVRISIADFKATGDLEAFTKALEPFLEKKEKKK
jgi:hypothetical protein